MRRDKLLEMKKFMDRLLKIVTLVVIVSVGMSCAKRTAWFASPEIQIGQNLYYETQFEPLNTDRNFFYYFQLTISNKTDEELIIDWNKTQYLRNGSPNGVFIFQGITPDDIRNLTIPKEIIPAGGTFTKVVAPHSLVAWTPLGGRTTDDGRINPGIIPPGRNGMVLVVLKDGEEITEILEVEIEEREVE